MAAYTSPAGVAGAPAKLLAEANRTRLQADGQDLAFITVTVADKNGVMAPRAGNLLTFELDGPGEIVATDNGDGLPGGIIPELAVNGLAVAIVRAKASQPGTFRLKVKSDGLQEATVKITSREANP